MRRTDRLKFQMLFPMRRTVQILKHLGLDQPEDPQNRSPPSRTWPTNKRRYSEGQHIDYRTVRVAIDQRLILEAIRRISDAQLIQLVDEAARKGGLKATPRDDDTFLNDEKRCLFLLTAKPVPPRL